MFKNLSMWLWEKSPESEQAKSDTANMLTALTDYNDAGELIGDHPPINPDFGQLKRSGLLPVDDYIVEEATRGPNSFLPLTQVIRERVIDKGAVKFEVAERVRHIYTMESRRCGRKEIINITGEVIESMLKDAPIREKRVFGIVTSMGKILVNATGKAAEEYISYIKSLFGDGHIHIRPADLASWSPHLEIEGGDGDFLLITDFARKLIILGDPNDKNAVFSNTNNFQFSVANEKITVQHAKEVTIDAIADRVAKSYIDYIELAHEHAVFKLTSDLTLKSIKLQDLEYTPENDEETGLSAAYYRFYMSFFLGLFDTIVREVEKVN